MMRSWADVLASAIKIAQATGVKRMVRGIRCDDGNYLYYVTQGPLFTLRHRDGTPLKGSPYLWHELDPTCYGTCYGDRSER